MATAEQRTPDVTRYTQWCQFTHKHGLNESSTGELVLWTEHHNALAAALARVAALEAERDEARALVERIVAFVVSDSMAITYQSMGHYRMAILDMVAALGVTPDALPAAPAEGDDHAR